VNRTREQAERRFLDEFSRPPELLVRAPGRVNLLGAHVDYNDGWVLPAAIDRSIWLAAARIPEPELHAVSLDFEAHGHVQLRPPPGPPGPAGRSRSGWIEYASGVAWALANQATSFPEWRPSSPANSRSALA